MSAHSGRFGCVDKKLRPAASPRSAVAIGLADTSSLIDSQLGEWVLPAWMVIGALCLATILVATGYRTRRRRRWARPLRRKGPAEQPGREAVMWPKAIQFHGVS